MENQLYTLEDFEHPDQFLHVQELEARALKSGARRTQEKSARRLLDLLARKHKYQRPNL